MHHFAPPNCLYVMKATSRVLILILTVCLFISAQAQDTLGLGAAPTLTVGVYQAAVGENIPYNEGREFTGYGIKLEGHAFFEIDQTSPGNILYDGTLYYGVPMLYDLMSDEVVVKARKYDYLIRLSREKVPSFHFRGHDFFRADPDSTGNKYYETLYKGGTHVFARKRKQLNHSTGQEKAIDRFDEYDTYYILRDGEINRVSGKKAVLEVYKEHKDDLRKLISQESLNFKNDPENLLVRCATTFDQLKRK